MVILRQATIKYKGYDPKDLSKGSGKRVCKSCDSCGRIGYVEFKSYKKLCLLCVNKLIGKNQRGSNNPNWQGGLITKICEICGDEYEVYPCYKNTTKFCSTICLNKWHSNNLRGKNHYNWKGGFTCKRSYVLPENQCIKLNSRFKGSEMHHITKSIVIYIPKELHNHIYHEIQSNKNMGIINMLALQFINGEL